MSNDYRLILTLPYPVSANRYWATRVIRAKATGRQMAMTYVTPEAKAYRDQVALIARAAGLEQPIEGRVAVELDLYPHRPQDWARRARRDPESWDDDVQCIDLGNAEKVLADALQGIVFPDDRWIWRLVKERKEPDGEGRVVLRVQPIVRAASPQMGLLPEEPAPRLPAAVARQIRVQRRGATVAASFECGQPADMESPASSTLRLEPGRVF